MTIPSSADPRDSLDLALTHLSELALSIRQDDWPRPTPCAEWSVGEVFDHVLAITDKFTRFAAGETDAPRGRTRGHTDRHAALTVTISKSRAAWSSVDLNRACRLPFGDFPAHEAAAINAADVLVHTWDIGRGAGLDFSLPVDLIPQALATIRRLTSDDAVDSGQYALPPAQVDGTGLHTLLIASGRSPAWTSRRS